MMTTPDPWRVLGIPPGSSLAEARLARRRLAKQLHPDLHGGRAGLTARMTLVNLALADIETMGGERPAVAAGAADPRDRDARAPCTVPGAGPQLAHATDPTDPDSFSVECLPVEAFEVLFITAYGLGDILLAEEPYLLELYLIEPAACFCRLTVVPEAGASLVTVEITPAAETLAAPTASAVIEILVAELNTLVAP